MNEYQTREDNDELFSSSTTSDNAKTNLIVIGIILLIFTVIGYVGVLLQWTI